MIVFPGIFASFRHFPSWPTLIIFHNSFYTLLTFSFSSFQHANVLSWPLKFHLSTWSLFMIYNPLKSSMMTHQKLFPKLKIFSHKFERWKIKKISSQTIFLRPSLKENWEEKIFLSYSTEFGLWIFRHFVLPALLARSHAREKSARLPQHTF